MNATDGLAALVIAQLIYVMYKLGRLEAQVTALKRKVEDLYSLLNEKNG